MQSMISLLLVAWTAAEPAAPLAKLPAPLVKEMSAAVVAVGKALGLESWPSHGVAPCVDRGGPESPAKEVTRADAQRCATEALDEGFPALGMQYAVAILMAPIGPTTVLALGTGEAEGWAAPSCDPGRKCLPVKILPSTKWGKRVFDRRKKACANADTIWLPASGRACADAPAAAAPAPGKGAASSAPAPK